MTLNQVFAQKIAAHEKAIAESQAELLKMKQEIELLGPWLTQDIETLKSSIVIMARHLGS